MDRLCKNCNHCWKAPVWLFPLFATEESRSVDGASKDWRCALTDAVTGTGECGALCRDVRLDEAACAPDGFWWEERA